MEVRDYNNHLPEELDYSIGSKFSDVQIIRKLRTAVESRELLSGECMKVTEGGDAIVKLSSRVKGIIPRNQITYIKEQVSGRVHKGKAQALVYLNVKFYVKEFIDGTPENSKWYNMVSDSAKEFIRFQRKEEKIPVAILSRKEYVEEVRDRYKDELEVGHRVQGVVTGFERYGAFVDIGGDVSGVLHTGEICTAWIRKPTDKLSVGDAIDVVIKHPLKKKRENEILVSFTRKPMFKKFGDIGKYFKVGEVVRGVIKDPYALGGRGIFIEIGDAFEGLADYNGERFQYGDKVRVRINQIDKKREKIKFTIV